MIDPFSPGLEAGARFARGDKSSVIAKDPRVRERSVEPWRRAWPVGGMDGLRPKGPARVPKRSDERIAVLEDKLARGAAQHGWDDRRWTLERVRIVINRQFQIAWSA